MRGHTRSWSVSSWLERLWVVSLSTRLGGSRTACLLASPSSRFSAPGCIVAGRQQARAQPKRQPLWWRDRQRCRSPRRRLRQRPAAVDWRWWLWAGRLCWRAQLPGRWAAAGRARSTQALRAYQHDNVVAGNARHRALPRGTVHPCSLPRLKRCICLPLADTIAAATSINLSMLLHIPFPPSSAAARFARQTLAL